MKPEHVSILFAMISVDPTLAKKGRKKKRSVEEMMTAPAEITALLRGADLTTNISKYVETCSAQTYQNYKSAFKWWYEYSMDSWGKVAYEWDPHLDGDALVGRTVAQLRFTADEFDVLPLHFDTPN